MKCDEGYRCDVCGADVTSIVESDLYLRYVIGEVDPETLHTTAERHIRCNPIVAQFIDDERFEPVDVDGPMSITHLDADFVAERRELVTRGYRRLLEIAEWPGDRDLTAYPLPEAMERYRSPLIPHVGCHVLFDRKILKTQRTKTRSVSADPGLHFSVFPIFRSEFFCLRISPSIGIPRFRLPLQ